MSFEAVPVYEVPFVDQAKIFNRAFKGYLAGWHDMDADVVAKFITAQGIDLCYSRFARANGNIAGFGFIARTGNISRLAGMGTVPEVRRTGAAAFLLSHLLDEAKRRGDQAMVLEVFEQNTQALPLYRRNGFEEVMRLFGWRRPAGKSKAKINGKLQEISLLEAAEMEIGRTFPDIPWQVSRHIIPKLTDAHAYKIDNGCAIVADPAISPVRVHLLLGNEEAARDVLANLIARYPENEFFARQVFPEHLAGTIFEPLGFFREPLNQFLMRREL